MLLLIKVLRVKNNANLQTEPLGVFSWGIETDQ